MIDAISQSPQIAPFVVQRRQHAPIGDGQAGDREGVDVEQEPGQILDEILAQHLPGLGRRAG